MTPSPRVGIGLAVFNGEKLLSATVESLLAQTMGDFRLVLSDNASTDGTEELCRKFAEMDDRVVYLRQPTNLGPAANFNAAERAAGGDLFKWSAADDVYEPEYLQACVDALDADPNAVLAYPQTRVIDPIGNVLGDYDYEVDATSPRPSVRFANYLTVNQRQHMGFEIFGLIRRSALKITGPKGAFARADHVLCANLTLLGTFHLIPERLFLNRDHPGRSVRSTPERRYKGVGVVADRIGSGPIPADEWWDPSKRGKVVWPEWRLFDEYRQAVSRSPLSAPERRACYRVITRVSARHTPKLARDLLINAEFAARQLADKVHSG